MEPTRLKIKSESEAVAHVLDWQQAGARVVFTNGCFDLLHPGHIDYLERSRQLGQKLVVGVNTDDSVRRLKGASRPVNPEWARAQILAALESIDLVVLFDEDTPERLIGQLKPDVLVKGNDYEISNIAGAEIVRNAGGTVTTLPLVEGYSTTGLIEKIKTL